MKTEDGIDIWTLDHFLQQLVSDSIWEENE